MTDTTALRSLLAEHQRVRRRLTYNAVARAAVNALPALLAEVDRLRLALAELHNAVGDPRPPGRLTNAMSEARAALAAATPDGGVES